MKYKSRINYTSTTRW